MLGSPLRRQYNLPHQRSPRSLRLPHLWRALGQSTLRARPGQVLAPRRCEGRRDGRPSPEPAAPRPAPPCPGCSRFAAQLSTPLGANFSLCHYFGLHVSPGLSRLGSSPPSTTPTLLLWPASCLTTPSSPSSSPIPPFRICAQQRPETRRGATQPGLDGN